MKILLVILLWISLLRCNPLSQKENQINTIPHCEKDHFIQQGSYFCIKKTQSKQFFHPVVKGMDYQINVISTCPDTTQFVDTEKKNCVWECDASKIKNFINGSCETKKQIQNTIPISSVFSFNRQSVFSEEQMIPIAQSNVNIFKLPCPLIDLATRTCLKTLENCSGIIINNIFCKQCDCSDNKQKDKLCEKKCSCNYFFYQDPDQNIKVELKGFTDVEDSQENKFVCQEECDQTPSKPELHFVKLGKLCIPQKKCPYAVLEGSNCSKQCGALQKKYTPFDENEQTCLECQRVERNSLCSDKCTNLNHILVFNQKSFTQECDDKLKYPELAFFENKGCTYPFTLSPDGRKCLTECPPGSKNFRRSGSNLSKCIESIDCGPGDFESSDGNECVISCDRLLEEQVIGSRKCSKCQQGKSLQLDEVNQRFSCLPFNTQSEDAFTLEIVIGNLQNTEILQYIDRLGKEIHRIFNSVRELPTTIIKDRSSKLTQFQAYIRAAEYYHHKRQSLIIPNESYFYFDISRTSGYGIEEMNEESELFKQYYSMENIVKGVISVRFNNYYDLEITNRIKEQILRFNNVSICYLKNKCKETTLFFNGHYKITLEPIFNIQSDVANSETNTLFCVQEYYDRKFVKEVKKLFIRKAKILNENQVSCPIFQKGGVGLISLNSQEKEALKSLPKQIPPKTLL